MSKKKKDDKNKKMYLLLVIYSLHETSHTQKIEMTPLPRMERIK